MRSIKDWQTPSHDSCISERHFNILMRLLSLCCLKNENNPLFKIFFHFSLIFAISEKLFQKQMFSYSRVDIDQERPAYGNITSIFSWILIMHNWAPLGWCVEMTSQSAGQKLMICLTLTHSQRKKLKESEIHNAKKKGLF